MVGPKASMPKAVPVKRAAALKSTVSVFRLAYTAVKTASAAIVRISMAVLIGAFC